MLQFKSAVAKRQKNPVSGNGHSGGGAMSKKKKQQRYKGPKGKQLELADISIAKLVKEYYQLQRQPGQPSIRQFLISKNRDRNRTAFDSLWKDPSVQKCVRTNASIGEVSKILSAFTKKRKRERIDRANSAAKASAVLTEHEENYLIALVRVLQLSGNPIGMDHLERLIHNVIESRPGLKGSNPNISRIAKTLKSKHNIVGTATGHGIDVQRVEQATAETRDLFFAALEAMCALQHNRDPVAFPWKRYADVPPDHLYNMDDLSTDPTKHKGKTLGSRDTARKNRRRK